MDKVTKSLIRLEEARRMEDSKGRGRTIIEVPCSFGFVLSLRSTGFIKNIIGGDKMRKR